jgi:hypothetical protein
VGPAVRNTAEGAPGFPLTSAQATKPQLSFRFASKRTRGGHRGRRHWTLPHSVMQGSHAAGSAETSRSLLGNDGPTLVLSDKPSSPRS